MKYAMRNKLKATRDRIKETSIVAIKVLKLVWEADKWLFMLAVFVVIIPPVIQFFNAYLFKLVIDMVASGVMGGGVDLKQLYIILAILFVTGFSVMMSFSVQQFITRLLYIKVPVSLYQKVLNKIVSLDLQYFEDSNFQDTLEKVRDSYQDRVLNVAWNLFFLLQSVVQVSLALVAILHLNPLLAILVTLVSIPNVYNQFSFSRFQFGIWNRNTPHRKKYQYISRLIQSGNSIKELKIFQIAPRFLKEMYDIQTSFYKENKVILQKQLTRNTGFNFLNIAVLQGVAMYVIYLAFQKRATVGDINFYNSIVNNFNNGISGMFSNINNVFDHSQYVKSIFDLFETETKIKQIENPIKVDFTHTPKIEFINVSFKYPGTKKYVFKDFDLSIDPGEKVAFVGENGAGKTTLIKLLSRFYDVDEGEILIDGVNIKELDLESWYKSIGVLFQDFIRYEYPIKDNIYFGKVWDKENLEDIIDASKAAGSHEMIKQFEDEYNQMLGKTFEKGVDLSGGQWQKIALARAFFRNAPVLILDEPTAAIDAKAESEIFGRVEKLSKDKTVLIISHRFSTVRNADKIYVIENGKIKESGSHAELMKVDGQYATLFNLQAKGYQ